MWKERQSTTVIIETATLHAGTQTRSRVKTYDLNSSSGIQGAMDVEGRVEYHSDHRNSYTPCKHMHKNKGENLQTGFIKWDPWSNVCGRKGRVP